MPFVEYPNSVNVLGFIACKLKLIKMQMFQTYLGIVLHKTSMKILPEINLLHL